MGSEQLDIFGFKDMYGRGIEAGMTIEHISGLKELIYLHKDKISLGINNSDESHPMFTEAKRKLLSLNELDLNEWKIVEEVDNMKSYRLI